MSQLPTALITGASSGIGAVYADRFAKRGHNLVLVARRADRLETLAVRLRTEAGVSVEVLQADLADAGDLARVEARLASDASIGVLVNNAGIASAGGFAEQGADSIEQLLRLNVVALTRLSAAALPGFAARKAGAIVNVASVLGLAPEIAMGAYGATKAYVIALSQALQVEFASQGIYIQAVLPAATRTEIWSNSGRDLDAIPGLMEVDDLVDAALVGFDRGEAVTIPPCRTPDSGKRVRRRARPCCPTSASPSQRSGTAPLNQPDRDRWAARSRSAAWRA